MERTCISELKNNIHNTVKIQGFMAAIRNQKKVCFLIIRDHTGSAQAVYVKNGSEIEEAISQITLESSIEVIGPVIDAPHVKLGGVEINVEKIRIVNLADSVLPLDENSMLDIRLNWRFLDLRRPQNALIFKVQTLIERAMREFWYQYNFIEIHSPKLMGSASESGAELFKLNYFDRFAYLAQSPQFYKQMAIASGFDKVFEIAPVFRANPSFTSRHDTEFTSVDMEIAWIDSYEDIISFEEKWLFYVLSRVKEELGDLIQQTYQVDVNIPILPFPKVTMEEAKVILNQHGHHLPKNVDLDSEGEKLLSQYIFEKHGHEFVFITDYPSQVRPFYHMRDPEDATKTKSFDLLWKGLELTSGAQREHRYEILVKQAQEKGLALEPIKSYLDCFRFGCPPHGGLGFGLSRMLMLLLGFKNVREVTYLYRGPNRISP